ncbi:N-acetyltransferase-like protein [Coniochaeta ligniaria NRRL 30616]|uniref:N-acetyltransferase-like protein n=1 Tax=Coniochaeta ligniaria NRRL 30616 TaxID=1408157 RepID=A0A1J7JL97_9PEZI|nr:N-acetyltransferase-like protein [Coniochaeta ligniaria NRRL 30616]
MAGQNQRIPIRVRKGTRADINDVVRINVDAFGPGIMNKLLYPNGMSEEGQSKFAATMAKIVEDAEVGSSDDSKPKSYESFLAVAETVADEDQSTPAPEVIAFAWWETWREPRSEEEWDVSEPVSAYSTEGANDEIMEAFIGGIRAMRRRNTRGDPGTCLRNLCCAPTRSRLGAGSALLRWVTELADKEGLPCWLEASPLGYPLYRRFGFQDVEVLDLRLTERWGAVRSTDDNWGANTATELVGVAPEGVYRSVGMRRLPVKE